MLTTCDLLRFVFKTLVRVECIFVDVTEKLVPVYRNVQSDPEWSLVAIPDKLQIPVQ